MQMEENVMAKKKRRGKVVGKVFFVLGLILSISIGSMAATVVHKGDSMLGLINYDEENKKTIDKLHQMYENSKQQILGELLNEII